MKQGILRIAAPAVLAALLFTGCPWFLANGAQAAGDTGKLRVNIATGGGPRTITPPVVMEIGSFEVAVSGPGDTQTQTLGASASTTTFNDLDVGTWTATVNAYNTADPAVIIAVGESSAGIQGGLTTAVEVTVTPVAGDGTLNVAVSWPDDLLLEPSITASMTPESAGEQVISGLFDLTDNTGTPDTFTYGGSWAAGYYLLALSLYEGTEIVWADVWSVRIIEGETTTHGVALTETDVNTPGTGTAQVTIIPDLRNPYAITFDQQPNAVPTVTDTTITATLDPNDPPDAPPYRWYLNGVLQDTVTGNSITLGPGGVAVADGTVYQVTLIVAHEAVLSSRGFSFVADSTL